METTVYCIAHSLSVGVIHLTGTIKGYENNRFYPKKRMHLKGREQTRHTYVKSEYYLTKEEALVAAEKLKQKKIGQLKQRISFLENMSITLVDPKTEGQDPETPKSPAC